MRSRLGLRPNAAQCVRLLRRILRRSNGTLKVSVRHLKVVLGRNGGGVAKPRNYDM